MWLLTVRDTQHRGTRFAMTGIGVGLVMTLVLLVSGIAAGFSSATRQTVDALHDGLWLVPDGASGPFTSASAFPVEQLAAAVPDAVPMVLARSVAIRDGITQDIVLIGLPSGTPVGDAVVGGDPIVSAETAFETGDDVTVAGADVSVGTVVDGLTLFAGTPVVIAPIEAVQTAVFEGAPIATSALLARSTEPVDGFVVQGTVAVVDDALRLIESAVSTIVLLQVLLWIVAAILIAVVVYITATDRARDFALMKAVGARTRPLAISIVTQALIVAGIAVAVAVVLQGLLAPLVPLHVTVTPGALTSLPLTAAIVATLASLLGLRQATAADPAATLSGGAR